MNFDLTTLILPGGRLVKGGLGARPECQCGLLHSIPSEVVGLDWKLVRSIATGVVLGFAALWVAGMVFGLIIASVIGSHIRH